MSLEQEVEAAFQMFDEDNSGTLDCEEAKKFLEDWIAKNAKEGAAVDVTFEDIDINGDGQIDKEELRQYLFDQRMLHSEVFWEKQLHKC